MAAVTLTAAPVAVPTESTGALGVFVKRFAVTLGRAAFSLGLVLLLWQFLVWTWGEELSFSTRGPADVWKYLFGETSTPEIRSAIFSDLWTTLGHAGLGLFAGTAVAVLVAFAFNVIRPLEQGLMPVAMVLRSVPLVAMAPLISTIFGRGLVTVAIVGGIVTFFPTLVNVSLGLQSAPQQSVDLVKAYGGSRWYTLLRVQFPFALPPLFAALRATAPLAITGAMLAEFFLTGTGLGSSLNLARNQFKYNSMWSQAAIATLFSVLIYALAVGIEGAVLARFAPDRAKAAKAKA
jgi:ABC-type nitrate/sulfonate/bicarbonate transport system permease component